MLTDEDEERREVEEGWGLRHCAHTHTHTGQINGRNEKRPDTTLLLLGLMNMTSPRNLTAAFMAHRLPPGFFFGKHLQAAEDRTK